MFSAHTVSFRSDRLHFCRKCRLMVFCQNTSSRLMLLFFVLFFSKLLAIYLFIYYIIIIIIYFIRRTITYNMFSLLSYGCQSECSTMVINSICSTLPMFHSTHLSGVLLPWLPPQTHTTLFTRFYF